MAETRIFSGNYVVFHHSSTEMPTHLSTFTYVLMHPVYLFWLFVAASTAFLCKFHRGSGALSGKIRNMPLSTVLMAQNYENYACHLGMQDRMS